ncbi:pirin family protein [Aureibacter tunicatorum]|uniref:Pirin family protein n=1 Tax=Aureibacter tunicatorum TaxID=866807 RepID=A0AAE3XMY7_9BACT|nr:pirin family protein [Aureibacter tunicatorum]MDR6238913.1 hypothetical protein [Aureibacter tunicatorum]BDD05160.1 quercetin 2,3-dioxygenase [Aureibacter tunicatorum]
MKIDEALNIEGILPGVKGSRAFPKYKERYFDPFIMLDHIGSSTLKVPNFSLDSKDGAHPHRGFETVTILLEGKMEHRDSMGNRFWMKSGSALRMNAGKGIVHGGGMASDEDSGKFHEMQLWVNVPSERKMSEPRIEVAVKSQIPAIEFEGGEMKVIAGELEGRKGALNLVSEASIGMLHGDQLCEMELSSIDSQNTSLVYVLEGEIEINGKSVKAKHLAELDKVKSALRLKFNEKSIALLLTGKPIGEPIVLGGPFVMNTQEEINQAYEDFRKGHFGWIN